MRRRAFLAMTLAAPVMVKIFRASKSSAAQVPPYRILSSTSSVDGLSHSRLVTVDMDPNLVCLKALDGTISTRKLEPIEGGKYQVQSIEEGCAVHDGQYVRGREYYRDGRTAEGERGMPLFVEQPSTGPRTGPISRYPKVIATGRVS